jgi:uncharacterized protein (TIGR02246 family)
LPVIEPWDRLEMPMKHPGLLCLLASTLPLVFLTGCDFSPADAPSEVDEPQAVATTQTADDETSIRHAAAAFSAAFEAGDTTSLGNLYTDDALLLAPGDTIRGRTAIRRYFRPREGGRPFEHQLIADELQVHGDVAIDRGRWIQEFELENGGTNRFSGVYLVVWHRGADGRWRMSYDMWHAPYE